MKTLFWENVTKKIFFGNFSVKIDTSFFLEKHDQKNIFWKFSSKKKILVLEGVLPPPLPSITMRSPIEGGVHFSPVPKKSRYWKMYPPPPVPPSPLCTLFSSTKKIPVLENITPLLCTLFSSTEKSRYWKCYQPSIQYSTSS